MPYWNRIENNRAFVHFYLCTSCYNKSTLSQLFTAKLMNSRNRDKTQIFKESLETLRKGWIPQPGSFPPPVLPCLKTMASPWAHQHTWQTHTHTQIVTKRLTVIGLARQNHSSGNRARQASGIKPQEFIWGPQMIIRRGQLHHIQIPFRGYSPVQHNAPNSAFPLMSQPTCTIGGSQLCTFTWFFGKMKSSKGAIWTCVLN